MPELEQITMFNVPPEAWPEREIHEIMEKVDIALSDIRTMQGEWEDLSFHASRIEREIDDKQDEVEQLRTQLINLANKLKLEIE